LGAVDAAWRGELSAADARIEAARLGSSVRLVSLAGEIDLHAAPRLDEELYQAIADGSRRIVVDLTAATFVDSSVLGLLLRASGRLRETGGELVVVCDRGAIRRIFEVSGLDRTFPIEASLTEALWTHSQGSP
jgi:anti-sigma B factor antagonist